MELVKIAEIKTDFKEKFGLPRQSGLSLAGEIIFEKEYRRPEALKGLEGYSHLWILWGFDKAVREGWSPTVRPPRLGGNERVGVFASRSPYRPNPIGLTVVKLEKIDYGANDGPRLIVSGIDMTDGSPVYDIKPYLPHFDSVENATGGYADEKFGHSLILADEKGLLGKISEEKRKGLTEALMQDPRPSYQDDGRTYGMSYAGFEIKFCVLGGVLYITDVTGGKTV